MKLLFLSTLLFCVPLLSHAMSPFEQHVQAVSQSTSAFYMHALSDGDERYLKQFNKHKLLATRTLKKSKHSQQFISRWSSLTNNLKFNHAQGEGYSLPRDLRMSFREYLSDVYLHYKNQAISNDTQSALFDRIQLANLLLAARALDSVSSDYGSHINPDLNNAIDQHQIALQIENDIQKLLGMDIAEYKATALRRVNNKFKFLKQSLVNYEAKSAYFLLYSNIRSINKLLNFEPLQRKIANN